MKHLELRKAFIDFFQSQGHHPVVSSGLIPHNDPSLMFTNAGMNQFKNIFLGKEQTDRKSVVTIQKCLRAGGKHNDLENVGFTPYHHTFFEMMGNFSFGDYFKREAIILAWEFLTKKLNIPEERLLVSVFTTDDESAKIWEKDIHLPKEKILRYGEKDNFWRMGQTGPCGPCSEIFYDHNPSGPKIPIHKDTNRFVEIWNLVFMEFFEDEKGGKTPLPKPCVDTGAGLERLASILQGYKDNYQCDIFKPLMARVCEMAGLPNNWETLSRNLEVLGAVKVVCDHARATSFLIGEGVFPSNEGSGYVLRRIMRRAIRYAKKLNGEKSLFSKVCAEVIRLMGPIYPELVKSSQSILQGTEEEEKRFLQTLDKGSRLLNHKIQELIQSGKQILDGQTAFTLYDTYGFPFDLTAMIAKEKGFDVDEKAFLETMEEAKQKARRARERDVPVFDPNSRELVQWSQKINEEKGPTSFTGYEQLEVEAELLSIHNGQTEVKELKPSSPSGWLVFKKTPFYAQGGGQVSDSGVLIDQGQVIGFIDDCQKINDIFIHHVTPKASFSSLESPLNDLSRETAGKTNRNLAKELKSLVTGQTYTLKVHRHRRQSIANNHSATHLLNSALRKILGKHIKQAGSLVNEFKLRFDFTHPKALTLTEIREIEEQVNSQVSRAVSVGTSIMSHDKALQEGALCLSGEKYGDSVRVISMGEKKEGQSFSMELCGGTHVTNTSQIRLFKIVSEGAVAGGIRRLEAITSDRAFHYLNHLAEENLLGRRDLKIEKPKADDKDFENHLVGKIQDLKNKIKKLEQKLKNQKSQNFSVQDLLASAIKREFKGQKISLLFTRVEADSREDLRRMADQLRDKKQNLVLVLIGSADEKKSYPLVLALDKTLKGLHAGELIKPVCQNLGGRGGGRADFAQGSITKADKIKWAKEQFYELFKV